MEIIYFVTRNTDHNSNNNINKNWYVYKPLMIAVQ